MKLFRKIIALLIILVAILSLAVSLFFIIQIWKYKPTATTHLVEALEATSATLDTSAQGLTVVNDTLSNASSSITTLAETTLTLADNVNKTSAMIDSFGVLFTVNLPTTITNTVNAISSAQQSAAVVDGVLLGLASVPFIGIEYDPEESLSSTLGNIAESLETLPSSIKDIGIDMETTGTSLVTLETNISSITDDVDAISKNMEDAQLVIEQYQEKVDQLNSTLQTSITMAPQWVTYGAWGLTFLIVWLMVAQLGLLLQGIHYFTA